MIVYLCKQCGAENPVGRSSCERCGASLAGATIEDRSTDNPAAAAPSQVAPAQVMAQPAQAMAQPAQAMAQPAQAMELPAQSTLLPPGQEPMIGQPTPEQSNALYEVAMLFRRMKSGGTWFYWIAGLTALNAVLLRTSNGTTFIVGLGITQLVDIFAMNYAFELPDLAIIFQSIGIAVDVFFVGLFVFFGWMATKGKQWAFLTGMVLYTLDMVFFLVIGDYFAGLFHLLALFYLFNGWRAARALEGRQQQATIQAI